LFVVTCSELYRTNDMASIKIGMVKVNEYEKSLVNAPFIQEYLIPLVNNMILGLQSKADQVQFTPLPKIKNLTSKIASRGVSQYVGANHELTSKMKEVKNAPSKFEEKHKAIIKTCDQQNLFSRMINKNVPASSSNKVLQHYNKSNLQGEKNTEAILGKNTNNSEHGSDNHSSFNHTNKDNISEKTRPNLCTQLPGRNQNAGTASIDENSVKRVNQKIIQEQQNINEHGIQKQSVLETQDNINSNNQCGNYLNQEFANKNRAQEYSSPKHEDKHNESANLFDQKSENEDTAQEHSCHKRHDVMEQDKDHQYENERANQENNENAMEKPHSREQGVISPKNDTDVMDQDSDQDKNFNQDRYVVDANWFFG